eukprot:CAMPEP_0174714484 /NCGR_PEP_ID=MMETSP1094-20130205/18117_1 /TAXON_ID=156173 /ORGANISM="Chrysochromulina brevifilum, Strain UTEX LB 985" /LENGTH=100 /DNA_ID=CAMNT_0015913851 /DNA_START=36 /DNA_END=338 /DNA_ORIENTATION=+
MPPVKMRNMPEERKANMAALKEVVNAPDLIGHLKSLKPDAAEKLDSYLTKYQAGTLRGPAAYTLCKNACGLETMKKAFEDLVPGYSHEHSAFNWEHPAVM